jgi:hypothetical protein
MAAAGYVIEQVLFQVAMAALFLLSIAEVINGLKPENRPKIKIFQKLVIPGTLIFSFFAMLLLIDFHGIHGIFTNTRPEIWLPLFLLFPIIPMLCFGIVWVEQMFVTVCRVTGNSGPFGIAHNPALLNRVKITVAILFAACDVVTAIVIVVTGQLRFASVLFGPVAVVTTASTLITRMCQRIVQESELINTGTSTTSPEVESPRSQVPSVDMDSRKSTIVTENEKKRENLRRIMHFKITVGYILSISLCVICTVGFFYSISPLGFRETMNSVVHADPNKFEVSGVFYCAFVALYTFLATSLSNLGLICGKNPETFQ